VAWYGNQVKDVEWVSEVSLWYTPRHDPVCLRWVLVRYKEDMKSTGRTKVQAAAFFCTDLEVSTTQILAWFVGRWNIEVTFEEARAHLGFETQRQWSPRALGRTTPCLLGLFSLVVLMAKSLYPHALPVRHNTWYRKEAATFSDALAAVRAHLWITMHYTISSQHLQTSQIPTALWYSPRSRGLNVPAAFFGAGHGIPRGGEAQRITHQQVRGLDTRALRDLLPISPSLAPCSVGTHGHHHRRRWGCRQACVAWELLVMRTPAQTDRALAPTGAPPAQHRQPGSRGDPCGRLPPHGGERRGLLAPPATRVSRRLLVLIGLETGSLRTALRAHRGGPHGPPLGFFRLGHGLTLAPQARARRARRAAATTRARPA
jgi:hypothetical protein